MCRWLRASRSALLTTRRQLRLCSLHWWVARKDRLEEENRERLPETTEQAASVVQYDVEQCSSLIAPFHHMTSSQRINRDVQKLGHPRIQNHQIRGCADITVFLLCRNYAYKVRSTLSQSGTLDGKNLPISAIFTYWRDSRGKNTRCFGVTGATGMAVFPSGALAGATIGCERCALVGDRCST